MRSARGAFILKADPVLSLADLVDNVKEEKEAEASQRRGPSKLFKQIAKKAVVDDVDKGNKASTLVPPFLGYIRVHEKKYAYQIGQLSIVLREARGVFESTAERLDAIRLGLDPVNNNHIQTLTVLEASQGLKAIIDDMDEKADWLFDSDAARAKLEQTYGVVSNPAKITATTMLGKAYEDVVEDAKEKHPEDVSRIAATVASGLRYQARISGGWKNVLYKMDGSMDMQMPLDSWSDADKVEILSLMLQNSKQETATAAKQAEDDKAVLEERLKALEHQVNSLQVANINLFNKNMDEERLLAEGKVARLTVELGRLEDSVQQAVGLLRGAAGSDAGGFASPKRASSSIVVTSAPHGSPPPRSRSPAMDDEVELHQAKEGSEKSPDAKLQGSSVLNVSPKRSHDGYVPVKVAHKPSSTPDMITFSKPAVLLEPLKRASNRPSTTATRRKQKVGKEKMDELLMRRQQDALASRRFETTASFSFSAGSPRASFSRTTGFPDELFAQSIAESTRIEDLISNLHAACKDVADRILFTSESGGSHTAPIAGAGDNGSQAAGSLQDTSSIPIEKIKASDILLRAHMINHEISSHIQQSKRLDGMLKEITKNYQASKVDAAVGDRRLLSRK